MHLGFLFLQFPRQFVPPDPLEPIQVSYLSTLRKVVAAPPNVGPGVGFSGPLVGSREAVAEVPAALPLISVPSSAPQNPLPPLSSSRKRGSDPIDSRFRGNDAHSPPVTVRDIPAPSSSTISSLPEGEFALLQHKQQVRQQMKAHLPFPPNGHPGTVRLRLVLGSGGQLLDLALLETSDSRLAEAALKGAQSTSPYPVFPKEMKRAEVSYDFIVQYRTE